jgi:hypothetical protein
MGFLPVSKFQMHLLRSGRRHILGIFWQEPVSSTDHTTGPNRILWLAIFKVAPEAMSFLPIAIFVFGMDKPTIIYSNNCGGLPIYYVQYYLMRNLLCFKAINEVVRDSGFEQKEELLGLNTYVYDSNDELETKYNSRNPLYLPSYWNVDLLLVYFMKHLIHSPCNLKKIGNPHSCCQKCPECAT